MGNELSVNKTTLSFEDMEDIIQQLDVNPSLNSNLIIIHTLKEYEEHIHIKHTTHSKDEINLMNTHLNTNKNINICIYGKHHSDSTVMKKYEQLQEFGFTNISIYTGGLFEWLTLNQLYGEDTYPIHILNSSLYNHNQNQILDFMLKYKPEPNLYKLKYFMNKTKHKDKDKDKDTQRHKHKQRQRHKQKLYNIQYLDNGDYLSDDENTDELYITENDGDDY